MVKIITGKMDSGKTSKLLSYYQEIKQGDGIISKKKMIDKDVYGYYAYRLSDSLEFPFMIHEKFFQLNTYQGDSVTARDFAYQIGPYKVYKHALKKVKSIYKELLKREVSPMFFDEVGMLEYQNKCFYRFLKKATNKDIDIIFTIREDLIDLLIKKLKVKEYQII